MPAAVLFTFVCACVHVRVCVRVRVCVHVHVLGHVSHREENSICNPTTINISLPNFFKVGAYQSTHVKTRRTMYIYCCFNHVCMVETTY